MGELENLVLVYESKDDSKEVLDAIKFVQSAHNSIDDIAEELKPVVEQNIDSQSFETSAYQVSVSTGYDNGELPAYSNLEYEGQKGFTTETAGASYNVQTEHFEESIKEGANLGFESAQNASWGEYVKLDDASQEKVNQAKSYLTQFEWFLVCAGKVVVGQSR
jgi:flavin-binding protein dodecin